jgi:hypothetical protein
MRQKILSRVNPVRMRAILDEAVLHRLVGGASTMREQLLHLAYIADLPNIHLSILPWTAGAHGSPEGAFDLLVMNRPYSNVGYAETPAGAIFVERADADRFGDRHARLQSCALSADDSKSLLLALSTEF